MAEQEHVARYKELWVHRDDIHAVQTLKGSYFLRHQPVTDELIAGHLDGKVTCGWYALDANNTCRWAAVDSDQPNGLADLQKLHRELNQHGLPSYIEGSARGGHLWVFAEPIAARPLRRLIIAAVDAAEIGPVEVFPKQATVDHTAGRVGSVIRGPLGVHRKALQAFGFLDPVTLESIGPRLAQFEHILSIQRVSPDRVADALASLMEAKERSREPAARAARDTTRDLPLIAKIGDLYTFVSRYVELDERGRGSCPFHRPDRRPSFVVNREDGYWIDFHEFNDKTGRYVGGDAVEFFRRLRGLSRAEALRVLGDA